MISGMAPSLVRDTSRVFEGAMFRQLIATPTPNWRKSSLGRSMHPYPESRSERHDGKRELQSAAPASTILAALPAAPHVTATLRPTNRYARSLVFQNQG